MTNPRGYPDRIVATMVVRPDLCTAGGILHGGAFMAFADALEEVFPAPLLASRQRTVAHHAASAPGAEPASPLVRKATRDPRQRQLPPRLSARRGSQR